MTQIYSQVDRQGPALLVGQVIESGKCVLQMLRGNPIRGPRNRSRRRGAKMRQRPVPYSGAKGVECQPIGFFAYLIGIILFSCRERGGMQGTPSIGRPCAGRRPGRPSDSN